MHHVSGIGGGSYCLLNVVKSLDRTVWEPIVALKSHGPLEYELRRIGIPVVFFPEMTSIPYNKSIFKKNSIQSYYCAYNSAKSLRSLLLENHINVVYLNNMMLYPYLRSAKECGCNTVLHVREHWPLDEHRMQLKYAQKYVYKYADVLIAINKYSASMFPKKCSVVVYDWIDMSERYKEFDLNRIFGEDCSNKIILLFNGGLQLIKGPDYIINSFSKYIKGDNYRLLLLGVDSIPYLTGIRHKIKCLLMRFGYKYSYKMMVDNIQNDIRIKCIPAIYEIEDIINKSSCYISYFRIPHANLSLAENLLLQKPCIAADNEEAREYTNNGDFAMLVEPNNIHLFADNLKKFLSDLDDWKLRSEKASEVIREMFDKTKNVSKLNDALKTLVS